MGRASKDRRDIFYRLAKEEGWRARSAFKLLHIDQTFNIFQNVTKAVDLCAAPGSWSQVLAQKLPRSDNETNIVAVDLQTMAPLPGVACLKGDITRKETADEIIATLGGHRAQLVICDGAPDVIGFVPLDQVFQSRLVLAALNIAICILEPNGTFVSKFFRGNDDNTKSTYMRFRIFFKDVVLTKPRSSRTSSAECFILARGFKLPAAYCPDPSYFAFNRFDDLVDLELRRKAKLLEASEPDGEFRPYEPSEALLVPMVLCGDLSGFDSETTYSLPAGYKSLPPVQPPIAPAYAEAVARMKQFDRNRDKQYRIRLMGDESSSIIDADGAVPSEPPKIADAEALNGCIRRVILNFGGGADKLVGNIRETEIELKGESSVEQYTLGYLLKWIKNNLIVERPELLLSGDDDVRPGILVLVNDMDWELLDDKLAYVISEHDKISFISTLHGG